MKQAILDNFFANNSKLDFHVERKEELTADWILNKSHIPYLSLCLKNVPYKEMLDEAGSLDSLFVKHRSDDSEGWSSLCIHGISSQHTDHYAIYPDYAHLSNNTVPYTWTEIKHRCPVTIEYFKNVFPYDVYHRIRFMKLDPGGYILPHSDSTDLTLRAINFSLNNPAGCNFVFEKYGIVPFKNSGSAFLLANGYTHSVWNLSHEPRYHIIVHGYATTETFYNLVVESYNSLMPGIFDI